MITASCVQTAMYEALRLAATRLPPDVETARRLIGALEARAASLAAEGRPAVVLAPPDLRKPLFDFASRFVPDLWVISARELVPGTAVEPAGLVQLSQSVA